MNIKKIIYCILLLSNCVALPASASTTCQQDSMGMLCTSQVNFVNFAQQVYQTQYLNEWCWAASISMIFSYYGHPVSQPRIVSSAYGSPVNVPAPGIVMAQQLNKDWTDDNGVNFYSQLTGAFDPIAGVSTLNNNQLITELDQGHPIVIGTNGHAVVITQIQYYQTYYGPYIVGVGVFDPWPGMGARNLSFAEFTPINLGGTLTFVATARVNSTSPAGSSSGSFWSSPFGGCTMKNHDDAEFDPTLLLMVLVSSLYIFAKIHPRCSRSLYRRRIVFELTRGSSLRPHEKHQ